MREGIKEAEGWVADDANHIAGEARAGDITKKGKQELDAERGEGKGGV